MSQIPVSEINHVTNDRIYDRTQPSAPLRPYYQPRAQQTKYTKFATHTEPVVSAVPLLIPPAYSPSKVFYPANRAAPWSGFANNIDIESDMRNQFYGLQRCAQATYVPDSGSDLYTLQSFTLPDRANMQKHTLLFKKPEHALFNPNTTNTSKATFNNSTRHEMLGVDTRA
jgi:hypothetical protein